MHVCGLIHLWTNPVTRVGRVRREMQRQLHALAALQQLAVHRLKQCYHSIDAQALLVVPQGVAIRNVGAVGEQAKALVALAVEQLVFHLLVAEVVKILQDQDAP